VDDERIASTSDQNIDLKYVEDNTWKLEGETIIQEWAPRMSSYHDVPEVNVEIWTPSHLAIHILRHGLFATRFRMTLIIISLENPVDCYAFNLFIADWSPRRIPPSSFTLLAQSLIQITISSIGIPPFNSLRVEYSATGIALKSIDALTFYSGASLYKFVPIESSTSPFIDNKH
jgi:hypothetical protein